MMKKEISKIKNLIRLLCGFIILNLLVFVMVIAKQTIGRPYPVAKINMATAVTIHYLYEIPLTKMFGPYNILTKPVYRVRDYFYNQGLKHLPKSDAERYIWWSRIRFDEWYNCIQPELLKYIGKEIDENKVDKNTHLKWTDEIYNNLVPMGNLPLRDEVFKSVRFKTYNKVAWFYTRARGNLIYRIYYPLNSKPFPYDNPSINNLGEINREIKILNEYFNLKKHAKKFENSGFNKLLKSKDWYSDELLEFVYLEDILAYRIVKLELNCRDNLIQVYLNDIETLEKKVPKDLRISDYEKYRIQLDLDSELNKFILRKLNTQCNLK